MNNACPQCPWRTSNQLKRQANGFYTRQNLTRLWKQVCRGGAQSCHLTDPNHPSHIEAGCPADAKPRECPGSVVLIRREFVKISQSGETPGLIDQTAVDGYLRQRKHGLTKAGMMYWLVQRHQLGGVPFIGGEKLPEVNDEDCEIGLPEFLQ